MSFYVIVSYVIVAICSNTAYSDIIGCGGFLKSQVAIDFSSVNVKLYTKQGAQKDVSDCAPNNGYYFIPVYDNGEYILKIAPPPGWFFEPEQVPIKFDGVSDPCSLAQDIDFTFKGFALKGKISSRGSENGPEGITISMKSPNVAKELASTRTTKNGLFELSPVLPGKYILTADHPTLQFEKKTAEVTIGANSAQLPGNLIVVSGFDVSGMVVSSKEPVKGVTVALYPSSGNQKKDAPKNCDASPLSEVPGGFICHIVTDSNGKFVFSAVPSGKYILRPYYATFEVLPKEIEIVVGLEPVIVPNKFVIKGFSVKGRVQSKKGGKGLANVAIYIGDNKITNTDEKGDFQLDSMEPGTYTLSAKADDYEFLETAVKISPSSPELETLFPHRIKVCGRVVVVSGESSMSVEIVPLSKTGEATILAPTKRGTGQFCQFLSSGRYKLSVLGDQSLQFVPNTKEITVGDEVITGIEFNQLRATIRGRIVRLPRPVNDRTFSIKLLEQERLVSVLNPTSTDEFYVFKDISPGNYDIVIESNIQCYEPLSHTISVNAAEVTGPSFTQKGYVVRVQSSHPVSCEIKTVEGEKVSSTNLIKGDNFVCVPNLGKFAFRPIGCHGYDKESFIFDAGKEAPFELNAVSHDITGLVYTPTNVPVIVEVSTNGVLLAKVSPLQATKRQDGTYQAEFKYRSGETAPLEFTAKAPKVVFNPEIATFLPTGDCARNAVILTGEEGIEVVGRITPKLKDVKVTLQLEAPKREMVTVTDSEGVFQFGPLRKNAQYKLAAEKESYVLTGPDKTNTFQAHRLAQVQVTVVDNATNEKLTGVLLSLTGGENYRKNSMTDEAGKRTFHSLSPGEYFLRPMMKEYKFEPNSVIIHLKDGASKVIELKGRRVSFSVFGSVASLNGDPEGNVALEAVGQGECAGVVEEGLSESAGTFRIRGLMPKCEYLLQIKVMPTSSVYRIVPQDLKLKTSEGDITDVRLIAFQRLERVDVSVHVVASVPEHLKTLTVKLAKEDTPESPVHIVRLDTVAGGIKQWGSPAAQERFLRSGLLVQLPFIPRDGAAYVITIESTLSRNGHTYSEPSLRFVASIPYVSLSAQFHAKVRVLEQESPRHLVAILCLFIGIFVFWQVRKGWTIAHLAQTWWAARQDPTTYARLDNPPLASTETIRKKGKPRKT